MIKEWFVRLQLPRNYARNLEAEDAVGSRRAFRTRRFETVEITMETGQLIISERVFDFGQPDYGLSTCRETISGREAILQSYRGGGAISYQGKSFITYRAEAVYEVSPGRILRILANTADRRSQEEMLAAFRTVQFTN
ncbi:MAG: hypothetical protein ACR2HH_15310 [Chthoniobacterales bacterium]